jgi:Tfp pilus assembly protein PilX
MKHISFSTVLPKGSVLVFSLIILSIMLVTSLTLLSSAVLDQKASLSTVDSTRSFQVADSGAEQVLYQIYQQGIGDINEIASNLSLSCSGGVIENASAGWTIRFYDEDGKAFSKCDTPRDQIAAIKSEGSAQGTVRAVEVAVAQSGDAGKYQISCYYAGRGPSTGPDTSVCCGVNTITGEGFCQDLNYSFGGGGSAFDFSSL